MRNRLRNFRIRGSLLLKALNHSYIRKRYSYFVSSMSPHPIFTGWQLNRQAAWSAISRYIYLPQFSQTCHNYNVFDNRVVCVCLFCVILFKQSELSGCMGCVNMLVTGRMCVWWASYSTSATVCKLPSAEHSLLLWKGGKGKSVLSASVVYWKLSAIRNYGQNLESWDRSFSSTLVVVLLGLKWFAGWKVVPDLMWELTFSEGVRKIRLSQWNRSISWK